MLSEEPEHMRRRRSSCPPSTARRSPTTPRRSARSPAGRSPPGRVGEPFALWPRMQEITLEVVMRVGLRRRRRRPAARRSCASRLTELTELAEPAAQPRARSPLLGPEWVAPQPRLPARRCARSRTRRWPRCAAAAPSRSRQRPDIVSMLVAARREDGSPLGEDELRDELVTLLTDGPTSTSLAWTFERLLRNPETLARARAEIARRRRRRLPRRGGQGDAAAAPAGAGRRPPPAASRCGSPATSCRPGPRRPLHPPAPPRPAPLPGAAALPARALPRAGPPAPTPGSPSAAASAAASPPATPNWR